ncbi:DUF4440 domain-containing protein [Roseovarius sp. THAF27]|uniref:DUF4440 domain-containing protein n=1 Tax=Roseovarius sp. THAF27 TaxID=2587850 RepID=UPI0012686230|nr:DUF4440 domain-containing protein [Roseovarius sp. THAF27]
MKPTLEVQQTLTSLEKSLWDKDLHFDSDDGNYTLSAKFVEVDRFGHRHNRTQNFMAEKRSRLSEMEVPLADYSAELVSEDTAMATYTVEVRFSDVLELLHCVSLWVKVNGKWQLQLHQTTHR